MINYTQLASTERPDLTGYAVFERFDAENRSYTVCYTEDQVVRSARAANDLCESGGGSSLEAPTRLRFTIDE